MHESVNVYIALILTGELYTDAKHTIIKTSSIFDMSVLVCQNAKNDVNEWHGQLSVSKERIKKAREQENMKTKKEKKR